MNCVKSLARYIRENKRTRHFRSGSVWYLILAFVLYLRNPTNETCMQVQRGPFPRKNFVAFFTRVA